MRNKTFNQYGCHKESKKVIFIKSLDRETSLRFANIAKVEIYKARAKKCLDKLPREDGYVFIPNSFMDDLLKEDFSTQQFNEILGIFKPGRLS